MIRANTFLLQHWGAPLGINQHWYYNLSKECNGLNRFREICGLDIVLSDVMQAFNASDNFAVRGIYFWDLGI